MDCVAHRGFAGVAPENTVAALERAATTASMVEFDVRRCGSGDLVVIHDETVDRVTDASGPVSEYSLADLTDLDVLGTGAGVPTVGTVLDAVPEDTGLNIELKERGLAEDLAAALDGHDHELLVSSFDDEALREAAQVADWPLATVVADDAAAGLDSARALDADAVHPHWELIDRAFVEQAHEQGVAVNCWTIRSDQAASRARQAGVDGIVSDDPRFCRA